MATINEIKVGNMIRVNDEYNKELLMIHALFGEAVPANEGEVVCVEPTAEEVEQYPELNPNADGEGKVVYFDAQADRHYLINADMIDIVEVA